MRQDLRRGRRRERSARQVVQRWEELPVVPAFYSSRLVVFPEVTVSVRPCSCQLSPHPVGVISCILRRKVGAFSLGGEAIRSKLGLSRFGIR